MHSGILGSFFSYRPSSRRLLPPSPTTVTMHSMETRSRGSSDEGSSGQMGKSSKSKGKVEWSTEEESILLNHLVDNMVQMASNNTFRPPVWNDLVKILNQLPQKKGIDKTVDSCKGKYKNVCICVVCVFTCILTSYY